MELSDLTDNQLSRRWAKAAEGLDAAGFKFAAAVLKRASREPAHWRHELSRSAAARDDDRRAEE